MKRDIHSQAEDIIGRKRGGSGERFAGRRTRLEEAEESDVGSEIRAREDEPELDDAGAALPEHSAEP
jgi:hypothetical protein